MDPQRTLFSRPVFSLRSKGAFLLASRPQPVPDQLAETRVRSLARSHCCAPRYTELGAKDGERGDEKKISEVSYDPRTDPNGDR